MAVFLRPKKIYYVDILSTWYEISPLCLEGRGDAMKIDAALKLQEGKEDNNMEGSLHL
jgi:hypothetical protein